MSGLLILDPAIARLVLSRERVDLFQAESAFYRTKGNGILQEPMRRQLNESLIRQLVSDTSFEERIKGIVAKANRISGIRGFVSLVLQIQMPLLVGNSIELRDLVTQYVEKHMLPKDMLGAISPRFSSITSSLIKQIATIFKQNSEGDIGGIASGVFELELRAEDRAELLLHLVQAQVAFLAAAWCNQTVYSAGRTWEASGDYARESVLESLQVFPPTWRIAKELGSAARISDFELATSSHVIIPTRSVPGEDLLSFGYGASICPGKSYALKWLSAAAQVLADRSPHITNPYAVEVPYVHSILTFPRVRVGFKS